jgi:Fe-S oxidoreductase
LQAAGFTVYVPKSALCCGRPLYEFGMLDRAKQLLLDIFSALDAPLRAGTPIVVLEPACASVFRVESRALLPFHEQSKRLAQQTYLLAEFLNKYAPNFKPALKKNIVLHGHCHHHAHNELSDTQQFLKNCGAQFDRLDAGCCGMAGSFGFEDRKYAIAQKLAERALLPAVRNAAGDALIVSDGFSCREQIRQSSGRRALHLAEVIHHALQK